MIDTKQSWALLRCFLSFLFLNFTDLYICHWKSLTDYCFAFLCDYCIPYYILWGCQWRIECLNRRCRWLQITWHSQMDTRTLYNLCYYQNALQKWGSCHMHICKITTYKSDMKFLLPHQEWENTRVRFLLWLLLLDTREHYNIMVWK